VTAVYLEMGSRRVFACALDWPGWCRSGKDEERALEALAAYAPRYAVVAEEAGVHFPKRTAADVEVVERVVGNATTDFGAPAVIVASDHEAPKPAERRRLAALVEASWALFDRVAAGAPASLRKGPRGGGRDRDAVVQHVDDADGAYARSMGIKLSKPTRDELRAGLLDALRTGYEVPEKKWPPRYAARRIAWHALDHAWEIEDRSPP
jgi:hypothetical protein